MSARAVGILLAIAAAGAFEVSYVMLAAQARRVSEARRPDISFLGRLARRPWWLAAMALSGVAFAFEVAALRRVSLVVVQPLLGVGLIALVVLARVVLSEPAGWRQIAGAALVALGVTMVILGAPEGTSRLPLTVSSLLVVLTLVAILACPQFRRASCAWWLVAAAAAGDTLVALFTNSVAGAWPDHVFALIGGVAAVAACGLMAMTSESAALQRLPAFRVGPTVSAVQTSLPVLLIAVLGHAHWSTAAGGGVVLGVGVAIVAAGAWLLGERRSAVA